jgi:dihydrofolate synthase/folylpolyglutamate synthase
MLSDAVERLYLRSAEGIQPGLEVEIALLEALDNPHHALRGIHVAGTNGKGSVCAMLASMLRACGYTTGLYTSPHLVRFNERFLVNGHPIADDELETLLQQVEAAADALTRNMGLRRATFFEISTALAWLHFCRQRVDVAIMETGMGGIWDATNIWTPLLALITRIDVDHTEYLGTSLTGIAQEKAGIIKSGRPAVCGRMPSAARAVVEHAARTQQAPLVFAEEFVSIRIVRSHVRYQHIEIETPEGPLGRLRLPLPGKHQLENCAVAVTAACLLDQAGLFPCPPEQLCEGLRTVQWPARCQWLEDDPPMILDGAHNPCGAGCFADYLRKVARGRPIGIVFSALRDKDIRGMLNALRPVCRRLWLVELQSSRGAAMEALRLAAQGWGWAEEESSLSMALTQAKKWALQEKGVVAVCGSLYLAGEVLRVRGESGWSGQAPPR